MEQSAESIRQLGVAVFRPYLDLLSGLQHGYYDYDDYFDYSQPWLDSSDFVFLTPGWEDSVGTRREIYRAGKRGVPVFLSLEEVTEFLKPVVVCIVGESGSGKTLTAEWFERLFNYKLIQSYTTRPKRTPDENGHTFISNEIFDALHQEDMIAYTKFGEHRYCCLLKDVDYYNTYVIDEVGLQMLKERYSDRFHIYSIRMKADEKKRKIVADPERFRRDKGRFTMKDSEFDFIYHNIYDLGKLINFVQVTHNSINSDFISKCLFV